MYNNFEISLVVLMPNITTNRAITQTNQGSSSNSPLLTHEDQIPRPLEDSDNQIPSSKGDGKGVKCPGYAPGRGGGECWSFDLTDT